MAASEKTKTPANVLDEEQIAIALNREAELDYYVPNGRYWDDHRHFDKGALMQLDTLWMNTIQYKT